VGRPSVRAFEIAPDRDRDGDCLSLTIAVARSLEAAVRASLR
jgi:hypothetical protein